MAPWLSIVFMITTFASIGLPTLNNFVGEFLVLQGAAIRSISWAAFAGLGVILSACYMLWMYQRVFFGTVDGVEAPADAHGGHDDHAPAAHGHDAHGHDSHGHSMPDLSPREWACVVPLVVMMVWMGMYSQSFLPVISAENARILDSTRKSPISSNVKITPVTGGSANAR